MTMNVSADLFRIAAMFQSDETTLYYLCGVFVEPHRNGATLTATNGAYLVTVLDRTGSCNKPEIIQLSPEALRACKPFRKDATERRVVLTSADQATAFIKIGDVPVAVSPDAIVDGTFPDYRHVVSRSYEVTSSDPVHPAIAPDTMRPFFDAARALNATSVVIKPQGLGPALVTFPGIEYAFGVAMPFRANEISTSLPQWFFDKALATIAA